MKKILIFPVLILLIITGCSSGQSDESNKLSGTLKLGGSTTVYPIAIKAAEVFMQNHTDVTITVDQSSTGEGLRRFLDREIDIADGSRPPKNKEYEEAESKGMDIQMTVISNDAVVVVVNNDNPLSDLSIEELDKIFFTGEITDWSEITNGQKTGKINVYGTDPINSGTAELFINKIHKGGEFVDGYEIKHPTPTIVPTIAADPDGIGYTPLKWVDDSVVLLNVDGVIPSNETVLSTAYPLARKMLMMTDGTPKGLVREFIQFILSTEGQQIVADEGFIPIG